MPFELGSQAVRRLRPGRRAPEPERPLAVVQERERRRDGRGWRDVVTLFLVGAECPFRCVFCDLWRFTLEGPTPPGALPRQVRRGLAEAGLGQPREGAVKLYNASNFFEPRAVPEEDLPELASLVAAYARVTVECHPRLVGEACLRFADRLEGRLEVAMGLETVHPEAHRRSNKGTTPEDFERAARWLRQHGLGVRAFVLVGAPFVPSEQGVDWVARSAGYAVAAGAERVTLIPVRGGNGALEALAAAGEWRPPSLAELEQALDRCLDLPAIVEPDLWDLESVASCPSCGPARRERLRQIHRDGQPRPRASCARCAAVADG